MREEGESRKGPPGLGVENGSKNGKKTMLSRILLMGVWLARGSAVLLAQEGSGDESKSEDPPAASSAEEGAPDNSAAENSAPKEDAPEDQPPSGGEKPEGDGTSDGEGADTETKPDDAKQDDAKSDETKKDDAKKDGAEKKDETSAAGPATLEFQKAYKDWKKILADARALGVKYKTARPAEQKTIAVEYDALIAKGKSIEASTKAAAEAAFRESPTANSEAGRFLASLLMYSKQHDQNDEALRVAKLLIESGFENPGVYCAAGQAAFALDDFEGAEAYFQQAKEKDALDDGSAAIASKIKSHKYKALWKAESETRAAEEKANADPATALPLVELVTSKGKMVLELYENEAPNTVANFVSLVEKGFYDGVTFHRVLPGFMAQGGDPKGTGQGGPGYTIKCECYAKNRRNHFFGTLSMAHAGRDTGGSQFFITFGPTEHLDGKHTAFGRVIEGQDVLAKLQRRNPEDSAPPTPDKIESAKVLRKRDHEYVPETKPD